MPDATTLMTPKARDLLQKQERSASIVGFEEAVVDFFVDAADLLGVPKSVAVLYGIVFASPQPLSFADIQARGTLSKGSVSQGLRVLREMGPSKRFRRRLTGRSCSPPIWRCAGSSSVFWSNV